jgi:hypothetical protein
MTSIFKLCDGSQTVRKPHAVAGFPKLPTIEKVAAVSYNVWNSHCAYDDDKMDSKYVIIR